MPADSSLRSAPGGIDDLSLDIDPNAGDYRLQWDSQAQTSGSSTTYDVYSGLGSKMLDSQGDFSAGACLADDLSSSQFNLGGSDPPVGDFTYFMVRPQNGCGPGTYGGGDRDLTVGLSPSSCH
jgi:hypothetical protein